MTPPTHTHTKAGGVAQQENIYMFKAMSLISQNENQKKKKKNKHQAWWCMPVIPAFERWKQGNIEFKANLNYTMFSRLALAI